MPFTEGRRKQFLHQIQGKTVELVTVVDHLYHRSCAVQHLFSPKFFDQAAVTSVIFRSCDTNRF